MRLASATKVRLRLFFGLLAAALVANAQQFEPVPAFSLASSPIVIRRAAEAGKPFSVAGSRSGIFGEQDGGLEAWAFPVKILSHLRISAELAGYPVPIDVNQLAAEIEVNPSHTTITYSHAAFTIRQHMFAPRGDVPAGAGPIVLFEIVSIRPLQLTFQFTPEMLRMWPAANYGRPNAEWVAGAGRGYYVLHTDSNALSGGVALPGATSGILPPYQEKPRNYATEFKLAFDPKKDAHTFFPLLMTTGRTEEIGAALAALNARVEKFYRETEDHFAHFFDRRLSVETPDAQFDAAIQWAEIAIDQGRVKFHDETGLIAGWYSSGDSARPGYGWFFGRDTLWTLYAIDAYGDFDLSRAALEFLLRRQRADGKIMHEYSQSADLVEGGWEKLPYFYASADSTPLLVMAMEDFVNTTGDVAFLRKHWEQVRRAYAFTRAHDPDHDGIYNNSEGTGWVESWPPTMPNQEVYLAALDQQSSGSMARLAVLLHDDALAASALAKAEEIRGKLRSEYYEPSAHFYAFSRNANGSVDTTPTIYSSVAWWDGKLSLPDSGPMLARWASHEFSTDWGTRDVSEQSPIYDPLSYHQGTVWPLFTGWVSLAEYRAGQTISAQEHLRQNLALTWAQDLGACTELLSGAFYQPLGRSSSHQTWSSAMVFTPAVRGLLGIDWDALHQTLRVTPHLPANWDFARVRKVPLGSDYVDLEITRGDGRWRIQGRGDHPFRINDSAPSGTPEAELPLPAVEFSIPHQTPLPGSPTEQIKAIGQEAHSAVFEAPGGTTHDIYLRVNQRGVSVKGGEVKGDQLRLTFPGGPGYQKLTVRW